ncbi:hypothetical protein CALVIDRAFT_487335, partial [Calocera viscosa TUFC12733]
KLVYLPPYSPDYNPIESLFSSMKSTIRRNDFLMQRTMTSGDDWEICAQLHEIVWGTTTEDAEGWYRQCGYH